MAWRPAIADGGAYIATGTRSGHVHIWRLDAPFGCVCVGVCLCVLLFVCLQTCVCVSASLMGVEKIIERERGGKKFSERLGGE